MNVYIPIFDSQEHEVERLVKYININFPEGHVIFLAPISYIEKVNLDKYGECIDEDTLYDQLNIENVKKIIKERIGKDGRAGWYFQQFLKMSICVFEKNDFYVVWDSDTIPLRPVSFFDESGYPIFIGKREYHKPYFDTLYKLFCPPVIRTIKEISFISEVMIIKTSIMKNLICSINNECISPGKDFFEKIIHSISESELNECGFSEFETYGNYTTSRYPNEYKIKKFKTLRTAAEIVGGDPSQKQLEWLSKDFEFISLERSARPYLRFLTKNKIIINNFKAISVVRLFNRIKNKLKKILNKRGLIEYDWL
ncbi:hypothetical protein ADIMK_1473 [Marinobacterium lacunae]|uniref:Uncharacterized protein n=2 Tax=Marinobacterium lacunae TaxID=1232683 RepID=A0A081G0C2_9GAMM|nr:hypothetical protein ADIMK_1473 [Marinobacterium lacunae]